MFTTRVLKCRCHQRNEFNHHHWDPTLANTALGKLDDLIPKSLNVDICKTRHSQKFWQSLNNMKVLLLSDNPLEVYQNIQTQGNMNIGGPCIIVFPLLHLTHRWYRYWPVCPLGEGEAILTLDPDVSSVLVVARTRGGGGILVTRLRSDVRSVLVMRSVSPCWWSWGWGQEEDTRSQGPLISWPGDLVWSPHSQPLSWPPGGHSPSPTSCPTTWIENVLRDIMMYEDDDIPDARVLLWMTLRHVCRTPLTINTRGSLGRSWTAISLIVFSDKRESLYLFPI